MPESTVEPKLAQVIANLLSISPAEVAPETGMATLPEWDSMTHLRLILAVEAAFGVRFPAGVIPKLTSASAIQNALNQLLSPQ